MPPESLAFGLLHRYYCITEVNFASTRLKQVIEKKAII